MYGTYWKTKEGKEYFQATVPTTDVSYGHYSMYVYDDLVEALSIDKEVELVISFADYDEIYLNNKEVEEYIKEEEYIDNPKYKEIYKSVMNKHGKAMEAIYNNDVEGEEEEGQWGSCELCFYEGTHTFYSARKGEIVKVEL